MVRHGIGRSSTRLSTAHAHLLWTLKLGEPMAPRRIAFPAQALHRDNGERPVGAERLSVDARLSPMEQADECP
jgi:hypothetical protein